MKNYFGEEISEWENLHKVLQHIYTGCRRKVEEDRILLICNDGHTVDVCDIEASMAYLTDKEDEDGNP